MASSVVALLPNAGLANKLFVWAKAQVFARRHDLQAYSVGWSYPKLGPLLRGESSPRTYARYFEGSSSQALAALTRGYALRRLDFDPPMIRHFPDIGDKVFVFRSMPCWSDLFCDIREERGYVSARLMSAIRLKHLRTVNEFPQPVVALHVRRGDFRKLCPGEDFRRVGNARTPDDYFASIVCKLRQAIGYDVPVTLFSDGTDAELAFLLDLPNVVRSRTQSDVADLLVMSRARMIVTSAGSTFGEWAAYLSEACVLRHPDHIHTPIRPVTATSRPYEGPPPADPETWRRLWKEAIAHAPAPSLSHAGSSPA